LSETGKKREEEEAALFSDQETRQQKRKEQTKNSRMRRTKRRFPRKRMGGGVKERGTQIYPEASYSCLPPVLERDSRIERLINYAGGSSSLSPVFQY
jgi:hypothetical protein